MLILLQTDFYCMSFIKSLNLIDKLLNRTYSINNFIIKIYYLKDTF